WARDVEALAGALGLDRFAVLGWSMGGPSALAAAAALPECVSACGVAAGFAPFAGAEGVEGVPKQIAQGFAMAARMPWLMRRFLAPSARKARRNPEGWMDDMLK